MHDFQNGVLLWMRIFVYTHTSLNNTVRTKSEINKKNNVSSFSPEISNNYSILQKVVNNFPHALPECSHLPEDLDVTKTHKPKCFLINVKCLGFFTTLIEVSISFLLSCVLIQGVDLKSETTYSLHIQKHMIGVLLAVGKLDPVVLNRGVYDYAQETNMILKGMCQPYNAVQFLLKTAKTC